MKHFSGYGAYLLFLALRTHFNSAKYNFFEMNGKLRANKESYNKRHDKYFFEKLAREYNAEELKDFFVANLLNDTHYITEMLDENAKANYDNYKMRHQSLSYQFKHDLDKVLLGNPFKLSLDEYPPIILCYLNKTISHETMVVLNDFVPFADKFDKYLSDDIIWSKVSLKLRKYKPFVKYDKVRMKNILKEKIHDTRRESI